MTFMVIAVLDCLLQYIITWKLPRNPTTFLNYNKRLHYYNCKIHGISPLSRSHFFAFDLKQRNWPRGKANFGMRCVTEHFNQPGMEWSEKYWYISRIFIIIFWLCFCFADLLFYSRRSEPIPEKERFFSLSIIDHSISLVLEASLLDR